MKIVSLAIFLVMTIGVAYSYSQITNIQGLDNVVIRTKKYEDIKGTAYLYPSWAAGTLTEKSGKVFTNLLIKYDSYKDRVELNQDGQIMEISALEYPKFTLTYAESGTNDVMKHSFSTGYDIPGFSRTNYFDLIYEGRITLLRKYKTSFVEENVTSYGTSDAQKSFQLNKLYFVIDQNKISKELKLNKKSILEAFPEQSEQIETFLKDQKMKAKSESDLIKIITFLDKK